MRGRLGLAALALLACAPLVWLLTRGGQQAAGTGAVPPPELASVPPPELSAAEGPPSAGRGELAPGVGPGAAPHAGCRVLVTCQDESGFRVEGAQYWVLGDGKAERAWSEPDGAGDAVWIEASPPSGTLAIRAPGFGDLVLPLPTCPGPAVAARLVPECALEGVVSHSGGAPAAGLTLVAWPLETPLEPRVVDFQDPVSSCAGVLVCTSGDAGRFSFRGARAERAYSIYGGGSGLILNERVTRVLAPRDDLSLVVVPAFAALVTVADASGAPVPVRTGSGAAVEFSVGDPRLAPMASRPFEAVLAGLAPQALEPAPNEFLALVTGDIADRSAGPCRLAIVAPGYDARQVDFSAQRLDGGLARVEFVLPSTTSQFGSVNVRFVGGPQRAPGSRWPTGRVRLVGAQGNVLKFRHPGDTAELRLDRIPTGSYTLVFEAEVGGFRYPRADAPPVVLEVTAQPALVEVPLSDSGLIELEVVDGRSGQEYLGPLSLMVSQADDAADAPDRGTVRGLFPVTFASPPYQVPVAGPGTYKVAITSPRRDPKLHPQATDVVVVEAGGSSHHMISVLP